MSERFNAAVKLIDDANALDPTPHSGSMHTPALVYSFAMTRWLAKLYPGASEALQLAARAQHIRRWEVPRDSYPMDRAGYHRWRTGLYTFHADVTARMLAEVGYDESTIARVRSLLKKERLKSDDQTQALEDVICVVFLENYFTDFANRHDEEKLITILRRTWAKMSEVGRTAALKLPMPAQAAALIGKALSE